MVLGTKPKINKDKKTETSKEKKEEKMHKQINKEYRTSEYEKR